MKGVAARYPSFDTVLQRPVTLSQGIDLCQTRNPKAAPLKTESEALLGIEAFVRCNRVEYLSRAMTTRWWQRTSAVARNYSKADGDACGSAVAFPFRLCSSTIRS
jgi:hypothetical protein